jgi:polar amino acid transport system substrate-binding protein
MPDFATQVHSLCSHRAARYHVDMKTALCIVVSLMVGAQAAAGTACPALTRVGLSDLGYSSFRTETGYSGISVDVAGELARRTGCKISFLWFPRGRLFVELEAGRIDLTLGAVHTPERDLYASYLPYAYVQYDMVLSKRVVGRYNGLADFVARGTARLNITRGVQYGAAIEAELATLAKGGRLELVNDFDTVFNKMAVGRADGTLASPPIYSSHIKRVGLEDAVTITALPESPPQYIGMYASRKTVSGEALATYTAALRSLVNDRTILAIYAKYMGEATTRQVFRPGLRELLGAIDAAP